MSDYSVAILSCGHKFHLHCIQGWKNTQGKSFVIILIYVVIVEILTRNNKYYNGTKKDPKAISPKKKK